MIPSHTNNFDEPKKSTPAGVLFAFQFGSNAVPFRMNAFMRT